jgi:cytochrome oxidase Cu insertion factor (SCO1/SenC/PrrC family)
MVLLFLLFLSPVVIAWLIYYVFPAWQPSATMNHGELVTPVRPVPAFRVDALGGEQIDDSFLRGKWTIVYLATGACDKDCAQQLYNIRQVRLAQGKNIDRLQRLMLWKNDGVANARQTELQTHFPGQVIAPVQGQEAVLAVFALDEQPPLEARRIYLVDPLGNLMMSYEADDEPQGMIKDLERLLKYSGLG